MTTGRAIVELTEWSSQSACSTTSALSFSSNTTARRNREFYERIHQGTTISKALAFPLKMPVKSAHYSANGLMVAAMAATPSVP